jgi:hypothetical protein
MSYTKELVGEAAEMMCLGYTDHEIIRILRVPASQANDLIIAAEDWNYEIDMQNRQGVESYTEEIVDDMAAFYGEDEGYVVYPHGEPDPASW